MYDSNCATRDIYTMVLPFTKLQQSLQLVNVSIVAYGPVNGDVDFPLWSLNIIKISKVASSDSNINTRVYNFTELQISMKPITTETY